MAFNDEPSYGGKSDYFWRQDQEAASERLLQFSLKEQKKLDDLMANLKSLEIRADVAFREALFDPDSDKELARLKFEKEVGPLERLKLEALDNYKKAKKLWDP